MIAGSRLRLFVTGVMLLVHNDKPDVGYRQKDRTPCANDHKWRVAGRRGAEVADRFVPFLTFSICQTAMIDYQPVAEDTLQTAGELGSQRYLRHKIQHIPPLLQL